MVGVFTFKNVKKVHYIVMGNLSRKPHLATNVWPRYPAGIQNRSRPERVFCRMTACVQSAERLRAKRSMTCGSTRLNSRGLLMLVLCGQSASRAGVLPFKYLSWWNPVALPKEDVKKRKGKRPRVPLAWRLRMEAFHTGLCPGGRSRYHENSRAPQTKLCRCFNIDCIHDSLD